MRSISALTLSLAAAAATLAAPASAQMAKPLTPSQKVGARTLIARIDTNCAVVAGAIKTEPAIVVRRRVDTYSVTQPTTTTDDVALERRRGSTAEVWRQAGHLVWVKLVGRNRSGGREAAQLCYRADGSLARARLATSMNGLDAVASNIAWFNTNGARIAKVGVVSQDDPNLYRRVERLPFFDKLPQ